MSSLTGKFPDAKVVDGVNQSSEEIQASLLENITSGQPVTLLTLPPKGSANDLNIKEWDQVILTPEWQERAKQAKIPYETEFFVVGKMVKNSEGNIESYNLNGSMGGGWSGIDWNQPNVIAKIWGNMMG